MRRIALAVALAFVTAAVAAGSAGAATSKSAFEVFVEPTISAASNRLTVETELEGAFNVADKTASGSGTHSVMAGSTVVESGTFTLAPLVAFQFYGCGEVGDTPLPPNFCAAGRSSASTRRRRRASSATWNDGADSGRKGSCGRRRGR